MTDSDSFDIDVDALYDDDDVEVHRLTRIDPNVLGRQNFYFGKTLGEGAFARVVHAKMKNEFSPEYAIKIMEKSHIHKEKKVAYVMMEKQILSALSHPFIIKYEFLSFLKSQHFNLIYNLYVSISGYIILFMIKIICICVWIWRLVVSFLD